MLFRKKNTYLIEDRWTFIHGYFGISMNAHNQVITHRLGLSQGIGVAVVNHIIATITKKRPHHFTFVKEVLTLRFQISGGPRLFICPKLSTLPALIKHLPAYDYQF